MRTQDLRKGELLFAILRTKNIVGLKLNIENQLQQATG